jgi:hypothetical protein
MEKPINIDENIDLFQNGLAKNNGRHPNERYASFDYCFNYFQSFREQGKVANLCSPENLEMSCLQIGFYLASWGMLRGSSFLLEKSIGQYKPLIKEISTFPTEIWQIDADSYTESNIQVLMDFKEKASIALGKGKNTSDTLITKIMLGIFGSVPAFDSYFMTSFKVTAFNKKALEKVADYYKVHKVTIDQYSQSITTYEFNNEADTGRHYTKAKIIDMIGFMEGYRKAVEEKKMKLKKK